LKIPRDMKNLKNILPGKRYGDEVKEKEKENLLPIINNNKINVLNNNKNILNVQNNNLNNIIENKVKEINNIINSKQQVIVRPQSN